MPTFTGDEALSYDKRIGKLVLGYELLHHTTAAQLSVTLDQDATILVIGAGTGKDIIELAKHNAGWQFIAQDISADMLAIADQNFTNLGLSDRVTIHLGPIKDAIYQADAALCLLVLHFVSDNGDKAELLKQIGLNLRAGGQLFLADLMQPDTDFERAAQLHYCQKELGLTDAGAQTMRHQFQEAFYPISGARLHELTSLTGFCSPSLYFKALGFSAHAIAKGQ
ncbi:class I SAM-dependent methyltransferase [Pseudoalteromonas luteoviolacea]|uniref:class I SAM-dependent methyltransferase n=1 Tax=Pseudoalteromonas luteoviolacea TaxID=43657 RepID=UPI001B3A3E15|nr:class I SAM-dependent methyltransferase [Pseudoalteromonas luteoviolacea]MBQ4877902.1 class I SAM-dependent methyltransferase [Pseudoalteromonas luteoviolacea]MBQ4906937.1 class I SAM-dependent methyltransferase [Pseudoalteromonas luteoviolacea]